MEFFFDLLSVGGRVFGALIVLYGAYLAIDFHFHTSAALNQVIARLALYDSLGRNGLVMNAKEEVLKVRSRSPVPMK
jgi:hypothetical protein